MLEGKCISAFTVEKDYCTTEKFHDIDVIPFEELELHFPKESINILICIGYNKMNRIRERIYEKVKEEGYSILSYIHPKATVLTDKMGIGNIILENASIGIGCSIGEGNVFIIML